MRSWLLLGFGLVILLSIVGGLVSYSNIKQISWDLHKVASVEMPLEQAILEMEINARESAHAVLDYVRELEPEHIEAMRDSEADFERFAADFVRLAGTGDERRLGQEVARLYEEFKALGNDIVALADRRRVVLEALLRDALVIDELMDEKLQKIIDRAAPNASNKLEAALEMEINIKEAFAAIKGYVLRPDPALRHVAVDAKTDFEHFQALYRESGPSVEEVAVLNRIDLKFAQAVTTGDHIMSVTDSLNRQLEILEEHLKTIDALLDDEIQPLIHAETMAAAGDAKASAHRAAGSLIVIGLAGLFIAITAAWMIYRGIIGPIRALVQGTELVGGGNFDHRIDIGGRNEFSLVATAFNQMAKKLDRALRSVENARDRLERRVEERTAELVDLADDLRIARDEARAADRAKSEFLAAMSHELRTPLNAIIGFSEIIAIEKFGPVGNVKYCEYSRDIHEAAQHLAGLISDILDLSKIESGKDELHEEIVEVPKIIRSALMLVGRRAELCQTKLELDLADQIPAIQADERKLKQTLVNLLSNAIKFTDTGGKVTLRAWCRIDSGHVFQIVDSGIGIAPNDIPEAFSRFGQISGDLNHRYEGTGLGLPLAKALVEQHGGSLDFQSEVGVGTSVTVHFPTNRIVASLGDTDSLDVEDRAQTG